MRTGLSTRIVQKQTREQLGESTEDGIRFVLSTDQVDLAGDVIVQNGLSLARSPLPAQIDHGGGLFDLIGEWRDFKIGAHETTAVLKLLKRGVSRAADLVRDLYQEGVQLAASIGFVPDPNAYELIRDEKNDYVTGIKWQRATLTEASVVVTPANPSALARIKSLDSMASNTGQSPRGDARAEILTRLQGTAVPVKAGTSIRRATPMNIGEQVRAAEAALNTLRDKQLATTKALDESPDDETARTALITEMDGLNGQIGTQEKALNVLRETERSLAARAQPIEPGSPAILLAPRVPEKQRSLLITRAAVCTFEAYLRRVPIGQILEERYGRDPLGEATKAVTNMIVTKAAQNPAMTIVPEWAGALVRDGYGAFMEDLQRESVVPQIPMQKESFDGFNSISVASRASSPTADPNLAAAFRAEGAPIRVGSVNLTSKKLTPKSMGIIGTFTMELFRRSTPNIENKIREWMISDTAVKLDTVFLGSAAGSAIQPAGIANALPAGDTAASTGNTVANITADLRARVQSMYSQGLGRTPVWIMNPARLAGLALATTAAGTLAFPTASGTQPTLLTFPVITSITVPAGNVYLIDAAEIAFAGGAPEFMGTEVATLHEEYDPALVAPIVGGGGTPVAASPSRSLYQTFSAALRAIWEVDWAVLRAGAVQLITGAAW